MFDAETVLCLGVVSHLAVLGYLVSHFKEERRLFDLPVRELNIGRFNIHHHSSPATPALSASSLPVIDLETPLKVAIALDEDAVPIVNAHDNPVGCFCVGRLLLISFSFMSVLLVALEKKGLQRRLILQRLAS